MKNKHTKGTVVLIQKDGEMTSWSTNLSHNIEIANGDIFSIDWGKGETKFRTVDSGFPIIAEEIEEGVN